jgi:hypothetical protein
MLTRRQSLLGLLSLALAPPAFAAADGRPDKFVAGLYKRALKNPDIGGFGHQKSDKALMSRSLRKLWDKTDAKANRIKDQLGAISFDAVTSSQTGDFKSYDLTITELTARTATIMAHLDRGDDYPEAERKDVVEYRLVDESGWKIDDIRGKAGDKPWSVRELLENYLKL